MPIVAILTTPACFVGLLLLIVLLLIAAALVARGQRPQPTIPPPIERRPTPESAAPRPPRPTPESPSIPYDRAVIASAPFEALAALRERLADVQRHLPPDSEDALWLQGYLNDLRNVTDDVYWGVREARGEERNLLLDRLAAEVARLDRTISTQLATRLDRHTDRVALHDQLDRLRRAVDDRGD